MTERHTVITPPIVNTERSITLELTEEQAYQLWYLSYRKEGGDDQRQRNRVTSWFPDHLDRLFINRYNEGHTPALHETGEKPWH